MKLLDNETIKKYDYKKTRANVDLFIRGHKTRLPSERKGAFYRIASGLSTDGRNLVSAQTLIYLLSCFGLSFSFRSNRAVLL